MQERGLQASQLNVLVLAMMKKLQSIESKLEQKVVFITVEDAISSFREKHLSRIKKPRNYKYLLKSFGNHFENRNMADISPEDVEDFILKFWEKKSLSTKTQMLTQLKAFFNWVNRNLVRKKGLPLIQNPCDLITLQKPKSKELDFIPIETMRLIIGVRTNERASLMLQVMATSGMRPGEVCGLRKSDIDGQVLTIQDPKSRRYNSEVYSEYAVIPQMLADRLKKLTKDMPDNKRVFMSYNALISNRRPLIKKIREVYRGFTPHLFRKWAATYWHRKGNPDMVRFVLRHRSAKTNEDQLLNRYVAGLSIKEACKIVNQIGRDLG